MEKVIVIITQQSGEEHGIVDLGTAIAKLTQSKLTVMLVYDKHYPTTNAESFRKQKLNINAKCLESEIDVHISQYDEDAEEAVLVESRFADLMILAREPLQSDANKYKPSSFVKHILSDTQCPVILAPRIFTSIDQIVFCYNDSPSSIFAIKQFSYLFPQFRTNKVVLLEIREFEMDPHGRTRWLLHHNRTREWLASHYDDFGFTFLEGELSAQLHHYFSDKKNQLVVIGAYGRNSLSTLFKNSFANALIDNPELTIFMAHK